MTNLSLSRPDVDFLITNQCVNQCRHCVFESGERLSDEMNTAEVLMVLRRIKDMFGVEAISITGGEPLSRSDFDTIYREASGLFDVTLISTGAGVTRSQLQVLRERPPRQVIVSLYGLEETHDSFCQRDGAFECSVQYLNFMKRLRQGHGTNVAVNIVCHQGNADVVPQVMKYLYDSDLAEEVKLLALSPVGRGRFLLQECLSDKGWIEFADSLREFVASRGIMFRHGILIERHVAVTPSTVKGIHRCSIGNDAQQAFSSCVHIDANGDVYPCTMLVRQGSFRLGNIRNEVVFNLRRYYENVRRAWSEIRAENCRTCTSRRACPGGCFGYHLAVGCDYRCGTRKSHFGCPDRYEPLFAKT